MGSRKVFKICLELNIVSRVCAHDGIYDCARERRVHHNRDVRYGRRAGLFRVQSIQKRLVRIVPAEPVRNRIGKSNILEGTVKELVVVLRITPGPNTIIIGTGKDRRVGEIRSI